MKVAPNAGSSSHALPLSSLAAHHPPVAAFLIASSRLGFRLSNTKQSRLKIPNREGIAIFHHVPSLLISHHPPFAIAFLIETLPISKIESTRTKHATKHIYIRYKTRLLRPPWRNALSQIRKRVPPNPLAPPQVTLSHNSPTTCARRRPRC